MDFYYADVALKDEKPIEYSIDFKFFNYLNEKVIMMQV